MSDTILVKSFMDIYPEWVAGECKVFHGATEVEKVVARDEHGKPSYILWSVEGEWWHAFGNDTLRVEWQQASEAPAPSAHASEAAADVTTSRALDDLAGDFVRFRMMLAETLGLADIELLDESNEEVCERVATLQTALAAAQERERGLRAALQAAQQPAGAGGAE